jgi:hypothetical protein
VTLLTEDEVVECACGRSHTPGEWELLRYVGTMGVPAGEDPEAEPAYELEMRDCPCGSTLSVVRD